MVSRCHIRGRSLPRIVTVPGCMILEPNGWAIWERIQQVLGGRIKATGHKNAQFSTLNDQLAAYISAMVNATRLVILSDIDGLLDAPSRLNGKIIPLVEDIDEARELIWGKRKKEISAGGMDSKLNTAELMMDLGIPMHLVNGKRPGVLRSVVEGQPEGTLFYAKPDDSADLSSLQVWLRTSAIAKGRIIVSTYIADLLRQGRHPNILSVGVEEVQQPFEEGDVVEVQDESGKHLGKGVARLSSEAFTLKGEGEIEGREKSAVLIRAAKFAGLQRKRK